MASFPNRRDDRVIIIKNRVLRGEDQIVEYCKNHGLCTICGQFKTHKKVGIINPKWEPMTITDPAGNTTVYKGYCIQATCYSSVDQVKELLGEITPRRGVPARRNLKSSFNKPNRNISAGSADSPSASASSRRKPFQPEIYKPPSAILDIPEHTNPNNSFNANPNNNGSSSYLSLNASFPNSSFEECSNSFQELSLRDSGTPRSSFGHTMQRPSRTRDTSRSSTNSTEYYQHHDSSGSFDFNLGSRSSTQSSPTQHPVEDYQLNILNFNLTLTLNQQGTNETWIG